MQRKYIVATLLAELNDDELGYSKVIEWVYGNLEHKNVLQLTIDDVYLLQYRSKILDIINEENESMIGDAEDDWIIEDDIKQKILQRLECNASSIKDGREIEISSRIIELLKLAIENGRYLYFLF